MAESAIPALTVEAGKTATVDVAGHFRDPDGDALSYEAESSDEGAATVKVSGSEVRVTGVFRGESRVTVTARDGRGGSVSQDFAVTVPNRAPKAVGSLSRVSVYKLNQATVEVSGAFSDPDGDRLQFRASSSNAGVATVRVLGSQVKVIGRSRDTATVTVTADDGHGGTAQQTFGVEVPNRPPWALNRIENRTIAPGERFTVTLTNHFVDTDGDAMSFTATSENPAVASVSVEGGELVVLGVARGRVRVAATAHDGLGGATDQPFEVTVTNGPPSFGADAFEREVAENSAAGTEVGDPVAATDGDGDDLAYSFVAGGDEALFGIEEATGQITVAEGTALDYESGNTDYAVRVVASDGTLADTAAVTIQVTDVPAPGRPDAPEVAGGAEEVAVSWSAPENEGPEITGYDLRYRAAADSDWTEVSPPGVVLTHKITGLTAGTTYSVQVRAESSEGTGEWSDAGEGTAEAANAAPEFDADAYERTVPENSATGTAVGEAVIATDDDGDDLTYSFATEGNAPFGIGAGTGQIAVAESAALDHEGEVNSYTVQVVASDGTLADTAAVTIRVTDVPAPGKPAAPVVTGGTEEVAVSWSAPANEGPEITNYDLRYRAKTDSDWTDPARLEVVLAETITGLAAGTTYQVQVRAVSSEGAGEWSESGEGTTEAANRAPTFDAETYEREVAENSAPGTAAGEPVTATDDDQDDLTYSFAAGGEAPFEIDGTTGRITVAEGAALNYESADTLFTVSVEASDGELAATAPVTIRVTNADDPGKVTLSPDAARVGVELTMTLMDEDGVLSAGRSRTWQRSADGNAWNDIGTGRMYNPVTADAGRWLRAVFTYSDGHGPGKRAVSAAVQVQPGNAAPDFGADAHEREVPENSAAGTPVGEPVTATDQNDDDLTYAFVPGGAKVPFGIDGPTGRIAVAEGAALNYESADTLFTVLVEASDGTLADTASVTIRVTDADDPGKVTLSPEVARVGVELTATLMDEDGPESAGRQRRWQRSRNGNSWNDIGTGRRYTPVTTDEGRWLRAVFGYTDRHGPGKRAASAAVKVLPANAKPSFGAVYEREVPENSPGGTAVGAPVAATDPDNTSLSYSFAEGGDEDLFGIVEGTGQITVGAGVSLDYESGDTLYTVSVEASDGELADTASVKIRVTNADDPGKIALSADVARVGVRLTATLMDQDRSVERSKMRTWQRSPDGAAWTMVVQGAARRFYTPTEADEGKYLRAVFTYTDGHGPGKRAESPAVMVVGATTPVVSFGADSYAAAPGGSADVAVLLSPAASSALAIEVVAGDGTHTVTFQSGASSSTLSVGTAGLSASDTVAIRFGDLPEGVAVGVPAATRIIVAATAGDRVSRSVVEDGSQTELEVEYAQAEYAAVAGGPGAEITLRMSPAADRRVAVPLAATHAASFEATWPDSIVFEPGDSLAAFVLEIPAGTGSGLLALGFGALPEAVSAGAVSSATVDIADHDPGPVRDAAFDLGLAVFGRAVAEGARQAVGARIDAVMRPAGSGSGTGMPGSAAEWAGRAAGTLASLTGAPLGASSASDMARRSGSVDLPTGRQAVRRLLPRLSFATALGPQSAQGRPRIGLWAEGSAQSFRGEPGIDYDGGLRALTVGADARIGSSALLGVSLMRSDGDLDYSRRSAKGSLGHDMNSVHPYLFLQPSPGIGLWAMAGYGTGDVRDGDRHGDSGASLRMLSGGVKVPLARSGAFGLALNGDAFTVGMSAEDGQREGSASRARALLEASWTAGGLTLATQAGARYDGGDADTGGGAETGASIGYAAHGLDLDLRGRLALGSGRHREWGAALRLAFDPGKRGEGFRLAVSPRHGRDQGGIHGLMDGGTFHAMTPATGRDWRLDAEAGYGLKSPGGGGALDSYTRLSADGRNRSWSFGSRYSVSRTLRLGIEGSRSQLPGQHPNIGLRLALDFTF
ncbi:MAG: cadherin domain-containing protein [Chloroflexota bacterium]|nr:cadherin domain-containing protein [Chloroflexota bacterium]